MCKPVALVTGQVKIHGIAIDTDTVYFTTSKFAAVGNDTVGGVPKAGGPLVVYSDTEASAQNVAVGGGRLYWTNWNVGALRSVPINQSGPVRDEYLSTGALFGIALSGGDAFVGNYSAGSVTRRALSDPPLTPPTDVVVGQADLTNFIVEGSVVTFTVQTANAGVRQIDTSMSVPTVQSLTSGDVHAWGITSDAQYYYYTTYVDGGSLRRINKSTLVSETMATFLSGPLGVAVDANFAYVAEASQIRRVALTPVAGNFAQDILAGGQQGPHTIVVDDQFIYWSNNQGTTLMKLAKPL